MLTLTQLRAVEPPPRAPSNPHIIDHRRQLCAKPCTLDGRPAAISGAALPFATVRFLDNGIGCEFAWPAVERVLAGSKNFRTL